MERPSSLGTLLCRVAEGCRQALPSRLSLSYGSTDAKEHGETAALKKTRAQSQQDTPQAQSDGWRAPHSAHPPFCLLPPALGPHCPKCSHQRERNASASCLGGKDRGDKSIYLKAPGLDAAKSMEGAAKAQLLSCVTAQRSLLSSPSPMVWSP